MNAATFTSKPRTSDEWSAEVAALELQVQHLKNRLAWFEKHVFGARSEKVPAAPGAESLSLFPTPANGTEKPKALPVLPNPAAPKEKSTPRRRPWPKNLARISETLLPPEGTLSCACCGTRKEKIGEDVTESLECAEVQHYVRSVSRPKFACPRCPEEGVVQSPAERRFIEKGNIGDSVVAQVALDKYLNHLPLTRQSKNYSRMGIDLPVSTMVGWLDTLTERFAPVMEAMQKRIRRGPIAFSDDTSIPVLSEDRNGGAKRGVMWLYSNGRDSVWFEYSNSRGQDVPSRALDTFRGYLHSDGYAGYNALHKSGRVRPVYCWAHARRKFLSALESGDENARRSLVLIGRLFLVERYVKDRKLPALERTQIRRRVSSRIVAVLKMHLQKLGPFIIPKSLLGIAIAYTMSRWDGFTNFLKSGRLALENNLSERNLRRVVIGRKNYMFCGSDEGARRAATLYSLVGTCEMIGLDPFVYLLYAMSAMSSRRNYRPRDLMPHNVFRILNP